MNERIKKVRKILDLTQQEFAERICMKRNSIALIENGRNTSDQTIASICREFNINEEWLRTGNGEMFIPDTGKEIEQLVKKYHLSHGMQIFIEKLVNTKPEVQEALISLIMETSAGIESIMETSANLTACDFSRTTAEQSAETSIKELEDEYKKSRSDSVSKTTLSASSIIEEKEKKA